jgi:twitching motility protein PilT
MKVKTGIREILGLAAEQQASDVHVKTGMPPYFRINRELIIENSFPAVTAEDGRRLLEEITTSEQRDIFFKEKELDFAYEAEGIGRFRVNAYFHTGTISLAFRLVHTVISSIEDLGLPAVCKELALKRDGLIILTGPTGCGKSTTMAAMLNYLNTQQKRNVITIEDPIEYLFRDEKCTFSQREVNVDTHSFASGLKHILRQDPDVILIGEMRDLETMSIALTAAETGHLVLTTLHTPSSYEAIDRLIDSFPAAQHTQIRMQLSSVLQAVLYQNLIPVTDGTGVVPAVEVLIASSAIRNLIREGKTFQMPTFLHSGQNVGMQTLDQALLNLYRHGTISYQEAASHTQEPGSLRQQD